MRAAKRRGRSPFRSRNVPAQSQGNASETIRSYDHKTGCEIYDEENSCICNTDSACEDDKEFDQECDKVDEDCSSDLTDDSENGDNNHAREASVDSHYLIEDETSDSSSSKVFIDPSTPRRTYYCPFPLGPNRNTSGNQYQANALAPRRFSSEVIDVAVDCNCSCRAS